MGHATVGSVSQVHSSKEVMVEVFRPWKCANSTKHGFFPSRKLVVKHLSANPWSQQFYAGDSLIPDLQVRNLQLLKYKTQAKPGCPDSWSRALCMTPHCLSMHTLGNACTLQLSFISPRLPSRSRFERGPWLGFYAPPCKFLCPVRICSLL